MVEDLEYLQGKDKMANNFKFFHGFVGGVVVEWTPEHIIRNFDEIEMDVVEELSNELSRQIAQEIDDEIINELTRRINSGEPTAFEGRIQRLNNDLDYFNRWLNMGGNRA